MAVLVKIAGPDFGPTRPGTWGDRPAADHGDAVHFPDRGLAGVPVLPEEVAMIGVIVGVVAKPLSVISNAVPALLAPPVCVVPKRSPLASATTLAPSPTPFAPPLKLTTTRRRAFVAGRCPDDFEHDPPGILGARVRGSEKVAIGVHDHGFGAVKSQLPVGGGEARQGGRGAGVAAGRLLDFKHRAVVVRPA